MPKMLTSTRSLLLAGALAFAALPVLAQTAPQTQPAAPAAGATTATPGASTDKGTAGKTVTGTSQLHGKKIASAHTKSNVHRVSTKKHTTTGTAQKPKGGSPTGTGGAQPQ